jgi:hypothetical protein
MTVLAGVAVLGVAGCGDEATPPEPVPGDLAVSLVSPNGTEGAAVLETNDVGVVEVTPEVGQQAFRLTAGGVTRIVVLLDEPGDIGFTLSVEDLNRPPQLQVVEVADAENRLRPDLSGYAVASEPVTGT